MTAMPVRIESLEEEQKSSGLFDVGAWWERNCQSRRRLRLLREGLRARARELISKAEWAVNIINYFAFPQKALELQ